MVDKQVRVTDLAGYRVHCVPFAERALLTGLLPDPESTVRTGTVLRESNYRVTSRVLLNGIGSVLVKFHRDRSSKNQLLALFRPGRARAEWDATRLLHAMGFPVAQPMALGERRRGLGLEASFFAGRFIDGMSSFRVALQAQPAAKGRVLLSRSARLIRALHDRGFDHRDLHAGNILAGPGPGDVCRLLVVDLHRSHAGRVVSRRARTNAIARWLHSLAPELGPGGRMYWQRAYWVDQPRSVLREHVRAVEAAIRRLERIRRRSRGKRCLKRSTVYTRDVGPRSRGARRRTLDAARLERALREHDEAMTADDQRVAKRARKSIVTRHGDLVVKEARPADWFGRVRDRLAPLRHRAAYVHAHQLGVVGVSTAQPLAYVRRNGRSFSMFEDLSRLERLDHLARRLFRAGVPEDRRRLLDESADWLARLHHMGVYHGDVKGVNVLVDPARRTWAFHLIDTDRCRFFDEPLETRRRVKNIAQLAASIPIVVSRADRLRWFRRYATQWFHGEPRRDFERRIARAVGAQLAQKILVVDQPIE